MDSGKITVQDEGLNKLELEIGKMKLSRSDVLIVTMPEDVPEQTVKRIAKSLAGVIDRNPETKGIPVLLVNKEFDIKKITETQLNDIGYYRKKEEKK